MTQQDINNAIASVKQYDNQVIAYPNGSYRGECTVPVYDYVKTLCGITPPVMANDSAEGWGLSFPASLAPFFTHSPYDANATYPVGTIFTWNSPHIAIATAVKEPGNSGQVLEQNADPNGAPVHEATRTFNTSSHTATYALVPNVSEAPATPAPSEPVNEGDYVINKQINGYMTATDAANHAGVISPVDVGNYFVYNQAGGMINVTKVEGKPGSWINPADNQITNISESAPLSPQSYTVVKAIQGYTDATHAANHLNPADTVQAGEYTVFNEKAGMINVTSKPGTPGSWINPADNVEEPNVPEVPAPTTTTPSDFEVKVASPPTEPNSPTDEEETKVPVTVNNGPNAWQNTYKKGLGLVKYVATKTVTVKDLANEKPDITLKKGALKDIAGTFFVNGEEYLRTAASANTNTWYGITASAMTKVTKDMDDEDFKLILDDLEDDDLKLLDKPVKEAESFLRRILNKKR